MKKESYDDRWIRNVDTHKAGFLQIPDEPIKFKTVRRARICQNDGCNHELKPNQKRFCSAKCYQNSRVLKKIDESLTRVNEFESGNPEILDVIPLTRDRVENHPTKIKGYSDLPVKYFLVVAV